MPALNEDYWRQVRARAKALGSDGCTAVRDWRLDCCLEHDLHRRTRHDIHGNRVEVFEADWLFRK